MTRTCSEHLSMCQNCSDPASTSMERAACKSCRGHLGRVVLMCSGRGSVSSHSLPTRAGHVNDRPSPFVPKNDHKGAGNGSQTVR